MKTLRLNCSRSALVANWSALNRMSGTAATGAAVKADGYGLGAADVVKVLARTGCRDFYVAHWQELDAVLPVAGDADISVLHGISAADMDSSYLDHPQVKPVLNSIAQVRRWQGMDGGRCDIMFDSGMNRLGIEPADAGNIGALDVDVCMSHLASADENSVQNVRQQEIFSELVGKVKAQRYSLANSAGIALGRDYHFDLTRPGLALYGGVQRPEFDDVIHAVVRPEAMVLQVRAIGKGDKVGYNATFTAQHDMRIAILTLGYADGYLRAFSNRGTMLWNGRALPVVGRVSMDLVAVDVSACDTIAEGDWLEIAYDLSETAALTGLSQYELLTGLGARFDRIWE